MRTVPVAFLELQLSLQSFAGDSAQVAGGEVRMHQDHSTVLGLFCFVRDEASERSPGRGVDMPGQLAVTHHVGYLQSLQTDHLVFVDQGAGELMKVVDALCCDMLMTPRYTDTGFGTVLGAFLFTG